MEHIETFSRLFDGVANYTQPAKKAYNIENVKHIAMKLIRFCSTTSGKAVVFGDKDVDGIFSSMIVSVYLRRLMQIYQEEKFLSGKIGVDIRYSHREKDGFGLSRNTYEELSDTYDLIITTDNGTSADFHSYQIDNLVVLDHHPLNEGESIPEVPYILNPNTFRSDGLEYSTSGGMVAYDMVRFIDKVLREQDSHYQTYLKNPDNHFRHERMLEVLKEFAGFTLVSDMAQLDRNNRRFVIDALQGAFLKKEIVPLYALFANEFTQKKLSFNINPLINIDRMGQLHTINPDTGKTYMESFIQPTTQKEWHKAYGFISGVNDMRKEIVKRETKKLLSSIDLDADIIVGMCSGDDVRIGLGGLIANKLSQAHHKPAIIAIPSSDGKKLSFSARGHNIKRVLSAVLEHAGGHQDACGGSETIRATQQAHEVFLRIHEKIKEIPYQSDAKIALIHDPHKPLSWKETYEVLNEFKNLSNGVETVVDMTVAVKTDELKVSGSPRNGKEWGKLGLSDKSNRYAIHVLHNFEDFAPDTLNSAEIIVLQLSADGTLSVKDTFTTQEAYLQKCIQHPMAKPYNFASLKNDISITQRISAEALMPNMLKDAVAESIYYYDNEELFDAGIVSDAVIVLPSMVEQRHPMRKREDTLELFVSLDADKPLSDAEHKKAIAEFGAILYTKAKNEDMRYVLIKDAFLNNQMISEENKKLMMQIFKSVSALLDQKRPQQEVTNENDLVKNPAL